VVRYFGRRVDTLAAVTCRCTHGLDHVLKSTCASREPETFTTGC